MQVTIDGVQAVAVQHSATAKICCVDGCKRKHHARGYCQTHYCRVKQYGRLELLPREQLEKRFWAKVDKQDKCWIWKGTITPLGYGNWTWREDGLFHTDSAHHFAFVRSGREIPEGYHLDHLCRNRSCCNPDHLEPVTPRENTLRGIGPSALNARKTHCKRGHQFTQDNTYLKNGKYGVLRVCRKCAAESARKRRALCPQ